MTKDKSIFCYGRLCLTGEPEFLSFDGTTWTLHDGALTAHLKAIADAGANAIRLLPWCVWDAHKYGKKSQFQPFFLDTSRDLWDTSLYDGPWFKIMKRIFAIANSVGLTVIFVLFDNCQMIGATRKWTPWYSNTQGYKTFYEPAADKYTRHFVASCLNQFKAYDWMYAWGNETNNQAFPDFVQRVIFPYVRSAKLDFNRMTYGATLEKAPYLGNNTYGPKTTVQGIVKARVDREFGEVASLNMFREVHSCGGSAEGKERPFGADLDQALYWWGKRPIRILFSDDGVWDGDSQCDRVQYKGKWQVRPSADTWHKMVSFILTNYKPSRPARNMLLNFEHLPKGGGLDCQVNTFKAISRAYHERFGKWPENYRVV
jgi:hypothetical protein